MPELSLLLIALLMDMARFENQRWIIARASGLKGSNEWFGLFVDWTGLLGTIFYYTFLAAYFYDTNFKAALLLWGFLFVVGLKSCIVFTRLFKGDFAVVWLISTFAVWPLAIILSSKVSWFGLLPK